MKNKVTIQFEGEDAMSDAQTAMDGYKWKLAMWDLDQKLRETTKYDVSQIGDSEVSDVEYNIAERYRDLIREILYTYNLNMED